LQCDRVHIFLAPDVAEDPRRARFISDLPDRLGIPGDEGDVSAAPDEAPN
jgi:hypothetical protein